MAKISDYYIPAVKNKRLIKELYKKMISLNERLLGRPSVAAFTAAYHSPNTQNEVRALLLYSLFSNEPINMDRLKANENPRRPIEKGHFTLLTKTADGTPQLYFRNPNKRTAQYEVYKLTTLQVR